MSTLTRRDRIALGANLGGVLAYGAARRWPEPVYTPPEPVPGVFAKFGAPHPGSTQRAANDQYGHRIGALTVSDIDGSPKIYSGYGGEAVNQAPIYIWPLGLDSVWDATYTLAFNGYGVQNIYHYEGSLWAVSQDHAASGADFCTGSPGGTWINSKCSPGNIGFQHPQAITRHDGYTWVAGQTYVPGNGGGVWRGMHPRGDDGEYVFIDLPEGVFLNRPSSLFSYQGKVWYEAGYEGSLLRYWDEQSHTFIETAGLQLDANRRKALPWKTVMVCCSAYAVHSFDGTSVTKHFEDVTKGISDFYVTSDDVVWILVGKVIYSSTDLVTWTQRMQALDVDAISLTVYEGFVYVGDTKDQIWRAKV